MAWAYPVLPEEWHDSAEKWKYTFQDPDVGSLMHICQQSRCGLTGTITLAIAGDCSK